MNALSAKKLSREELVALVDRVVGVVEANHGTITLEELYNSIEDSDDAVLARAVRAAVERQKLRLTDDLQVETAG